MPMSFNTWLYVYANPVNYTDKSGRCLAFDLDGRCDYPSRESAVPISQPLYRLSVGVPYYGPYTSKGLRMSGEEIERRRGENDPYRSPGWVSIEETAIRNATQDISRAYARAYNQVVRDISRLFCEGDRFLFYHFNKITPNKAFLTLHGGQVEFVRTAETASQYFKGSSGAWGYGAWSNKILFFRNASANQVANERFITHEMGHSFENALIGPLGYRAGRAELPEDLWERFTDEFRYGGFAGGLGSWQFSKEEGPYNPDEGTDGRGEIFADQFIGWVYNRWEADPSGEGWNALGERRAFYMNQNMPWWIFNAILSR